MPTNNHISVYESAKYWVAQYESVDELKDYLDKAKSIEEYARRANDYELEINAGRARVRAERRCGELLKEMDRKPGARTDLTSPDNAERSVYAIALENAKLSTQQSSKYQQLANVPEKEFEDAISTENSIPSAHGLLKSREETKRIDQDCLYLWGRLVDIEKRLFGRNINALLDEMTPAMKKDSERILPLLRDWTGHIYENKRSTSTDGCDHQQRD
jgi:hypothetical protein